MEKKIRMKRIITLLRYFKKEEIILWSASVIGIIASFFIFDRNSIITLAASLIGVTSILLNAKGNPIGQSLMIFFSILYGYISFSFSYYGEMITYIGMTMPMAVFALVSWLRHPFKGKKTEVEVSGLAKNEIFFMFVLSAAVTALFYFILCAFNTANIIPSTLSVTTSFIAVYLTFRRSPYFSLAYAFNDAVLLVLWTLASFENIKYVSVIVCFTAFLINDIYALISWKKMEKRQMIHKKVETIS